MKTIKTRKLTATFVEVDPVILEENSRTRRSFHGQLARDPAGVWIVRGIFVVERKNRDDIYPTELTSVGDLKAGELGKLELKTEHVKRLISGLKVLADAAEDRGITLRSAELIVGKKNEIVRVVEQDHKAVIEHLIAAKRGKDFWTSLVSLEPDVAAQLADASIQRKRKETLATFHSSLANGNWNEPNWKQFFAANQWIFGSGLRYQFLGLLQEEANYGGTNVAGKGSQRGEFLLATQGKERFTVVVEIKKPDSSIFSDNANTHPYRSGVPGLASNLQTHFPKCR
ncbi:MAG: Shedu anti-phage system protein SduA domain-containing protein [Candidatus Sulfotelmatobacter sp.]